MTAADRLSAGQSEVRVVVDSGGDDLALGLHARGWPATSMAGSGPTGPVTVLFVAVDDRCVAAVQADLRELAPGAFWSVERLGAAHAVPLPTPFRQVSGG